MQDEKTVVIIFIGFPQIIRTEEVKKNLGHNGFDVVVIARMHKKTDGAKVEMLLILAQLI